MYGYKFENNGKMMFNKWGVRDLSRHPVVLFETLSDLYQYTGGDRDDIEIVKFEKLWGFHSNGDGWHSDSTRKSGTKINLFDIKEEAIKCCPKGYQVVEFLQYINAPKKEKRMSNESPLKEFLLKRLTPAVEALDWDFSKCKEYMVSHPVTTSSGVGARSLTITPPRPAEELVQRALDECNFNDDFLFNYIPVAAGQEAKFPLDFFGESGAEAFIVPREGHIPERCIEGDEIFVPTFKVANAVDWSLDYKRDRRTDVLIRAVKLFAQGYIDKMVREQNRIVGFTTSSTKIGKGEGIRSAVWDMMTKMKRQNRKLTDVFVSPEAFSDLVNAAAKDAHWDHAECKLYGVRVHVEADRVEEMEETYYTSQGTDSQSKRWRDKKETIWQKLARWIKFAPKTQEFVMCYKPLVFGFDKLHNDSLIIPFRNESGGIFNDPTLTRRQKEGIYGWLEVGCAALNSKAVTVEAYAPGEDRVNNTRLVETRLSRVVAFTLPVERSGGRKGWFRRWW